MIFFLLFTALAIITIFLFLHQPKSGKKSTGELLEKIKQSPNYKNGQFKNVSFSPDLAEGTNYFTV